MSLFSRNPSFTNSLLLISGDIVSGAVAFHGGHLLRFLGHWEGSPVEDFIGPTGFFFIVALISCSFFMELYNQDRNMSMKETVVRVTGSTVIAFFVLSALFYMLPSIRLWRGVLVLSLVLYGTLHAQLHHAVL